MNQAVTVSLRCNNRFYSLFAKGQVFFYYNFMEVQKKQEKKVKAKQFMSRNVTQFQHFMTKSYITENDLNWVINLRDGNIPASITHTDSQPPEVYFKKTKNFELRSKTQDPNNKKYYASEYDYMILKHPNSTKQTQEQLNFYSTLRKQNSTAQQSSNKFDIYPYKDRGETPSLIKKESITKLRQLTLKDKESALDGAHKQAPYSQKIVNVKNHGLLETFTRAHGRSQISLPSLAWEMGLRNYRS